MKVKIVTTNKAPHHKANETIEVQPYLAEKMLSRGWAIDPNKPKEEAKKVAKEPKTDK